MIRNKAFEILWVQIRCPRDDLYIPTKEELEDQGACWKASMRHLSSCASWDTYPLVYVVDKVINR